MADIDLNGLNPRSFEQLVQALSAKILGPGVAVFGDGPDGGREAAFQGQVPYPSSSEKWSGYIVLQAKFAQRPHNDGRDATWLSVQLSKELQKFADKKRKLRKPEYYVLVTNIRLSPLVGAGASTTGKKAGTIRQGGREKVEQIFAEFKRKLRLKGFAIWDADQLRVFLEDAPSIRQSYAAWITPSDVLARVLSTLEGTSPDFGETMLRFVQHEMSQQRFVRLQEAGHANDSRIRLDEVFVDLPFETGKSTQKEASQDASDTEADASKPGLLSYLLSRASEKLDPNSIRLGTRRAEATTGQSSRPERWLVVGGPGQGKSTISQFLAQTMRSRILANADPLRVAPEIAKVADAIKDRLSAEQIEFIGPQRFPVRIDLPQFADALAKAPAGGGATLLEYVARRISLIASCAVKNEDLRRWLSAYPWLIILDGLDEVPATANRAPVIQAINEFWIEASAAQADVMVLITTRRQGYNDDLDPALYNQIELSRLASSDALRYGTQLAKAKLLEPGQQQRVLSRLKEAVEAPVTSRLLVTPLQVAIMLALIDQRGEAPNDRWSLFDGYYRVICDREKSKPGPVSDTLKNRSRDIDAIHHKAGLLLQIESEKRGSAEAYLRPEQFERLIRGHLSELGYDSATLDALTNEITAAATERLVFLVSRVEGQIGFEVRSLQEFMAAAYVMTGPQVRVQDRLNHISQHAHWRHVFQIAASKCFAVADCEHYRDTILTVCDRLNGEAGSRSASLTRAGGFLACALLEDDIAHGQPHHHRMLVTRALAVLDLGPSAITSQLVAACQRDARSVVETCLQKLFQSADHNSRTSALTLLWELASVGELWADELLQKKWDSCPDSASEIVDSLDASKVPSHLANLVDKELRRRSPETLFRSLKAVATKDRKALTGIRLVNALHPYLQRSSSSRLELSLLPGKGQSALSVYINGLDTPYRLSDPSEVPNTPEWIPLKVATEFLKKPSKELLASALNEIHSADVVQVAKKLKSVLPWPMTTCIEATQSDCTLADIAIRAKAGEFGDYDTWERAEKRLEREGVSVQDLNVWVSGRYFTKSIDIAGVPAFASFAMLVPGNEFSWIDEIDTLIQLWHRIPDSPPRRTLRNFLRFVLGHYRPKSHEFSTADLDIFIDTASESSESISLDALLAAPPAFWHLPSFGEAFSQVASKGRVHITEYQEDVSRRILAMIKAKPALRGALYALLCAGIADDQLLVDHLRALPEAALIKTASDSPHIREAIGVANLVREKATQADTSEAVKDVCNPDASSRGLKAIASILGSNLPIVHSKEDTLCSILESMQQPSPSLRYQLVTALRGRLDAHISNLDSPPIWMRLGFPQRLLNVLPAV